MGVSLLLWGATRRLKSSYNHAIFTVEKESEILKYLENIQR